MTSSSADLRPSADGARLGLRRAGIGDVEFLAETVVAANEGRYRHRAGWNRAEFLEGLIADATDQVVDGPAGSTTYVIEADDERVGRLRLVDDGTCLEVAGLQIRPDRQRHGIGSALLESLIADVGERKLRLVLEVETDNPDAQRLYERLGFRVTGPDVADRRPMSHRPHPPPA